jgi:hypothetical protein
VVSEAQSFFLAVERHEPTKRVSQQLPSTWEKNGELLRSGTTVAPMLIAVTPSTNNKEQKRNPNI